MATFDTWESYLYPPPDDRTLRNLEGLRDPQALGRFEYSVTALRKTQLDQTPALVDRTFDEAHACAIHRQLFQDVFEWAGQRRTVNMMKPGSPREFANLRAGEVEAHMDDVARLVREVPWEHLDREAFVQAAAPVFAHLNQAHPFREGNGRTSKIFMQDVAGLSGFQFDYDRVSPEVWNQCSEFSRPDIGQRAVHADALVPMFRTITTERQSDPEVALDQAAKERSPVSASYPKPAREALAGTQPGAIGQRYSEENYGQSSGEQGRER